jgi:hypothetical protein
MSKVRSAGWITPPFIFSLISIIASIFAVYSMSKGDLNTTLLILQKIQPLKLLTGVLATSFPMLIVYSVIGLLKLNQTHSYTFGRSVYVFPIIIILFPISLIGFNLRTTITILVLILVLSEIYIYSIIGLIKRKISKSKILSWRNQHSSSLGKDFWYGIPSIALILLVGNWLPTEQIEFQNRSITGFVISEENGQIIVLEEKHRKIVYLKSSELLSRSLCDTTASKFFLGFNNPSGRYPQCKE